jgi:N,N-dimethylformamidase
MIQAYFEEWSRRPGDRVRMAISTSHTRVRAVLERISSGPGSKGECRVDTESLADVFDVTVPGRLQNTKVGSFATLPLQFWHRPRVLAANISWSSRIRY